jgi:hypothetical protein
MNTKTAPATPKTSTSNTSAPVQTFRLGRIKAAVWENEADNKRFYNVTFTRTYLGTDKKFHDTDSFGRDDLPLIGKLANEAHTYIFTRLAESKPVAQVS